MKKLVLVFVILIGGAGGAYYYFNVRKPIEKPTVTFTTVSQGQIREIVQSTGTLEALRTMQVGSQVSGMVKEIYVDFNSIVHKDQLMAEIDPQLLQVQVDIQNANYQRQVGEIANQEVQLEDAKVQAGRTKALFEKQLVNQQQLEAADLTVKSRMTSLDSAKKQLLTTEASLNSAKLNVAYTKIYAPIDGVVINRAVDRGVTVQASMTAPTFFTLATDLRTLKLSAGVDEAEIGKIRGGMPVEFTVESYPGVTFRGDVEAVRLNASTANNVVTYPVWINAPNPDLRLKPAMTASIKIIVGTEDNVVRIPNQALRFRPTSDMYTALGLTPPTAGGGRVAGAADATGASGADAAAGGGRRGGGAGAGGQQAMAGGPGAGAPGAPPVAGAAPAGQGAAAQAGTGQGGRQRNQQAQAGGDPTQTGRQGRGGAGGQGGQGAQGANGQQGRGQGGQAGQGRGGFGNNAQFANMTPEQRQQMAAARGGGAGGRGGQAGQGGQGAGQTGGRGGGRGGRGGPDNLTATPVELNAEKIDDLFPPIQRRTQVQNLWTWDEAKKELKQYRVTTGITDGQFTQMVTGDVKVGQQVVSNIILPITAAQRQQNQSIFGQQPQRGGGGFGAAGPGGGGGGAPGGAGAGGGGGGGGRGGGGRGGGF